MYIVRDIFQLKFGHYKDVKALLDEAKKMNMFHEDHATRILTDFTGDGYRLILEQSFNSLGDYEKALMGEMSTDDWQKWYTKFKEHVENSHREVLKLIS
jgi:hypothetical protein